MAFAHFCGTLGSTSRRVSRINPETGRELTVASLLGPGDVFDVICLLDHREHEAVMTAVDDLENHLCFQ